MKLIKTLKRILRVRYKSRKRRRKMNSPAPDGLQECEASVLVMFPDICRVHLAALSAQHEHDPEAVITYLLDCLDQDIAYPKQANKNKRKRNLGDVGKEGEGGDDEKVMLESSRRYEDNARDECDTAAYQHMGYVPLPGNSIYHRVLTTGLSTEDLSSPNASGALPSGP